METDNYIDFVNGNYMLFSGDKFEPIDTDESVETNTFLGKSIKGNTSLPPKDVKPNIKFDLMASVKLSLLANSEKIDNTPAITKFVGILHVNTKTVEKNGIKKIGICRKKFTPFENIGNTSHKFPKMMVKTNRILPGPDEYAIVKYEKMEGNVMHCEIDSYLGQVGSYENDLKMVKSLACSHWVRKHDKLFSSVSETDLTPNRAQFLELYNIYSIDPVGCEDIDDALHVRKLENGYEVGIHIADVSSFIEENSILDIELANRTETVYFNNADIEISHMIPPALSLQHISLKAVNELGRPVQKRAFSVIVTLDINYDIINVIFVKSIIIVKENLSYEKVQELKETDQNLKLLFNIGLKLKEKIPNSFNPMIEYDTHQMVEVYMIYSNKLVAEKVQISNPDTVFLRVHNSQKPFVRQNSFVRQITTINSDILKKYDIICMERARYKLGSENCKHSSLSLDFYTHFTSPMRRYADIIVHRQLYKTISSVPLMVVPTKKIFILNYYSYFYKQVEKYSHLIEVASKINGTIEVNAIIVSISPSGKVKIYIPDLDLDYEFKIVDIKLTHLVKIVYLTNETNGEEILTVKNIVSKTEIKLKLFQQIKIKLAKTCNDMYKINISILEPDVSFILLT
jgi:hypothetical protein